MNNSTLKRKKWWMRSRNKKGFFGDNPIKTIKYCLIYVRRIYIYTLFFYTYMTLNGWHFAASGWTCNVRWFASLIWAPFMSVLSAWWCQITTVCAHAIQVCHKKEIKYFTIYALLGQVTSESHAAPVTSGRFRFSFLCVYWWWTQI